MEMNCWTVMCIYYLIYFKVTQSVLKLSIFSGLSCRCLYHYAMFPKSVLRRMAQRKRDVNVESLNWLNWKDPFVAFIEMMLGRDFNLVFLSLLLSHWTPNSNLKNDAGTKLSIFSSDKVWGAETHFLNNCMIY